MSRIIKGAHRPRILKLWNSRSIGPKFADSRCQLSNFLISIKSITKIVKPGLDFPKITSKRPKFVLNELLQKF